MQAAPFTEENISVALTPELCHVANRCELNALQSATQRPVPLDLICASAKAAGKKQTERLQAAVEEGERSWPSGSAPRAALTSAAFLKLVLQLCYAKVRCCACPCLCATT